MSTEQNKAKVRRLIEEVLNKGNLAVADETIASNYVYHFPGQDVKGREDFKQFIAMMRTPFPDINATIEDIIAKGDRVAVRFTIQGTFKGEMMGMAPTGKQLKWSEAVFTRFEGGKEVEATPYADMLSFYQQLGISPPTGEGGG